MPDPDLDGAAILHHEISRHNCRRLAVRRSALAVQQSSGFGVRGPEFAVRLGGPIAKPVPFLSQLGASCLCGEMSWKLAALSKQQSVSVPVPVPAKIAEFRILTSVFCNLYSDFPIPLLNWQTNLLTVRSFAHSFG
jgi:hypothetical protein